MKKIIYSIAIAFCCLIFMGCPYSSSVSIDEPTVKVPQDLIGLWKEDSYSDKTTTYKITKADEYSMDILKTEEPGESNEYKTEYKAHISVIDGTEFLNITENLYSSIYFYKIIRNIADKKITLHPVTENITEEFKTSSELKAFFKKNKDLSFFFDKNAEKFIKVE